MTSRVLHTLFYERDIKAVQFASDKDQDLSGQETGLQGLTGNFCFWFVFWFHSTLDEGLFRKHLLPVQLVDYGLKISSCGSEACNPLIST